MANTRLNSDIEETKHAPLCVDLDGTVVISDTLLESLLRLARQSPITLLLFPAWLLRGKAFFKAQVADRVDLDPKTLPYNESVVEYLHREKSKGRTIVLATAANEKIAAAVSDHLDLFDVVLASDSETNLSGQRKLQRMEQLYGEGGFDYVGNGRVDLSIWEHAREAIVVNPERGVMRALSSLKEPSLVLETPKPGFTTVIKAVRLYQWLKNGLIFIPLLAAHQWGATALTNALLAFIAFGLCASGGYLVNDMLDLAADRAHPTKRNRPLASGILSIPAGVILSTGMIVSGFLIGGFLPIEFLGLLFLYLVSTLTYSMYLKRLALVDVLTLAGLYTLRVVAGGAAVSVAISFWLLAFSMFLFLSLALVKRAAELEASESDRKVKGRGYDSADLEQLNTMGIASGYLAVLVIALYINSDDVVLYYQRPEALWFICPVLLFWVSRLWLRTSRGQMHYDPLLFAVKDRISQLSGLAILVIGFLAM